MANWLGCLHLLWELKEKNKNEPKQSKNTNWYLVGSCPGPSPVPRAFQVSSFPTPWSMFSPFYRCGHCKFPLGLDAPDPRPWAWFASVPLIPAMSVLINLLFKKKKIIYFWMHQVLVTARGILIVAHGLSSCPKASGILVPRPGVEPSSPALEGGFWTTSPPGKSLNLLLAHTQDILWRKGSTSLAYLVEYWEDQLTDQAL